ncbi:LysR family transcriptional regulator [Microbacterium sp. P06]|uniref:LysR family transcriptional regulator n=1 Tax=unclassified Microbacterium TaxID=2609290 RepID=UPI0037470864
MSRLQSLVRFVAAAEELHFPRAAETLGISLPALYSGIEKVEAEVGHPLFTRENGKTSLTAAGEVFLDEARRQIAETPTSERSPAPAGGKAKASKGKGRAPVVKGEPKPFKKRQGR